jgi:regulator of sirC expression with transglutaminase-like and TPR domain
MIVGVSELARHLRTNREDEYRAIDTGLAYRAWHCFDGALSDTECGTD